MTSPAVVRTRDELDAALEPARRSGVALVPTMGALHVGHQRLMEHARSRATTTVASIFVNPTQFGPGEDFDRYPRSLDQDLDRCARAGVRVVFVPEVPTMYPDGPGAPGVAIDPGPLGAVLEGAARPTHFTGVLTVVAKLFGLVRPDVAVFGEKDYQQLVLLRQMVRRLAMPVAVSGVPIVREPDRLAVSSRNRYLDPDERQQATALSRALLAGRAAASQGAAAVTAAARAVLDRAEAVDVDYLALTDADLGDPKPGQPARLLAAARVGTTRLIDNVGLDLPAEQGRA